MVGKASFVRRTQSNRKMGRRILCKCQAGVMNEWLSVHRLVQCKAILRN
jgi:hypothetical protein